MMRATSEGWLIVGTLAATLTGGLAARLVDFFWTRENPLQVEFLAT